MFDLERDFAIKVGLVDKETLKLEIETQEARRKRYGSKNR